MVKKFAELDTKDDGKLNRDEIIKVLQEEIHFDEDSCRQMVHDSDADDDGFIDKAEFLQLWSYASW